MTELGYLFGIQILLLILQWRGYLVAQERRRWASVVDRSREVANRHGIRPPTFPGLNESEVWEGAKFAIFHNAALSVVMLGWTKAPHFVVEHPMKRFVADMCDLREKEVVVR